MTLKPLKTIKYLEVYLRAQVCEVLSLQKKKHLSKIPLKVRAFCSCKSQRAEVLKCHTDTRKSPSINLIQYKFLPKKTSSFIEQYKKSMARSGIIATCFRLVIIRSKRLLKVIIRWALSICCKYQSSKNLSKMLVLSNLNWRLIQILKCRNKSAS